MNHEYDTPNIEGHIPIPDEIKADFIKLCGRWLLGELRDLEVFNGALQNLAQKTIQAVRDIDQLDNDIQTLIEVNRKDFEERDGNTE
jgi:hypothetical protein